MNPNWKRMTISTLLEDIARAQAVDSDYTLALILPIGGHDYGPSSPLQSGILLIPRKHNSHPFVPMNAARLELARAF